MYMRIIKIGILIMAAIVYLIPKKEGYEYNEMDKKAEMLNYKLSFLYFFLSIAGVTMIFFADNTSSLSPIQFHILEMSVLAGISVPFVSVISIAASVIARKRGKSKFGFYIQYMPAVVFIIAVILLFLCGLIGSILEGIV